MKHTITLLFFLCLSCSAEDYGFKREYTLSSESYELVYIDSEPDENHWRMGFFKFRWTGSKPIKLWGFGFKDDGAFRVRFETFSKYKDGIWDEVMIGYCGTGAETYELSPNKDYTLRIPLKYFKKECTKGIVMLHSASDSMLSKPFDVASLHTRR